MKDPQKAELLGERGPIGQGEDGMWEETTWAATALRVVILMALIATLTVVALHGDEWGAVAASQALDGSSLAALGELPSSMS